MPADAGSRTDRLPRGGPGASQKGRPDAPLTHQDNAETSCGAAANFEKENTMTTFKTLLALAAALTLAAGIAPAQAAPASATAVKNIVLVHGGFVDGSGWAGVHKILSKDGYNVIIVQNPTLSLKNDVEVTKRAIATAGGPVILVGHSYGGVVVSEAGNDANVSGLVYIAAFAPDAGESVSSLIANPPPGAAVPPILPPKDGFLFLDRAKFAADVNPADAQVMADSQVPWGVEAAGGAVTTPAWKTKPSYYLVATTDHMIPPPVQRIMASRAKAKVIETAGSHAVYVSKPEAVAKLIEEAAEGVGAGK